MTFELAITFGDQYRRVPHPVERKAHPDGYWVIEAKDWTTARAGAFERFGQHWAFDYNLNTDEFRNDVAVWYPRGELGRTRVTGFDLGTTITGKMEFRVTVEDVTS